MVHHAVTRLTSQVIITGHSHWLHLPPPHPSQLSVGPQFSICHDLQINNFLGHILPLCLPVSLPPADDVTVVVAGRYQLCVKPTMISQDVWSAGYSFTMESHLCFDKYTHCYRHKPTLQWCHTLKSFIQSKTNN